MPNHYTFDTIQKSDEVSPFTKVLPTKNLPNQS